jgi:hypothetical protein
VKLADNVSAAAAAVQQQGMSKQHYCMCTDLQTMQQHCAAGLTRPAQLIIIS